MVETGVWALDDQECSGEPTETRARVRWDSPKSESDETYRSHERTECKSILWVGRRQEEHVRSAIARGSIE